MENHPNQKDISITTIVSFCGDHNLSSDSLLSGDRYTYVCQMIRFACLFFREGILYSLRGEETSAQKDEDEPPTNLQFLDVLNEFTFRLIAQDKSGKTGV